MSREYFEMVYEDVKDIIADGDYDYIINNKSLDEYDIEQALFDELFVEDSVTGNTSGSYFMNSFDSREMVINNSDDVLQALKEFCYNDYVENLEEYISISNRLEEFIDGYVVELTDYDLEIEIKNLEDEDRNECLILLDYLNNIDINFETLDVITRCYYLGEALNDYLREEGII